ncbi:ABC transporter permease [Pseudofrankia inefficax]|uniref:Binding-protein-dependent transport systems inner membrane component n=1 Tax=Pseudofrankia inefficax (strain DSM 45817 / CECT 9037 / DDB 130130 / EuI1c) TaxID=298654 RepID=E3J6V5_PSEI1|nr:ABC transporter permease subunit [Pseudofrankia inefficax]ADP83175.1 binding-protein-dependent transport systems inner membrane component [Pseudofrankia inefficax]
MTSAVKDDARADTARASSRLSRLRGVPGFDPTRARLAASRLGGTPLVAFWLLIVAILVLPIVLFLLNAFLPRLFGQGQAWFTLAGFRAAFTGVLLRGTLDSLLVGVTSAVVATGAGFAVAWLTGRTDVPGRRLWPGAMFVLLLAPSYLIALGWERLLEPAGVLDLFGVPDATARRLLYGPVGVIVVLTVKGVPFAYLAISAALRGLGEEFEAAVRVHGGGRGAALRVVVALLAPAVWSALAIVFAESVSDFGVAATLANDAHFPVATYTLYNAVDAFPVRFAVAAAVGWVLLGLAGIALAAQSLALRGRSYQVLGGRSRPARRHVLSPPAKAGAVAFLAAVVIVGLGVPAFGAVSASLINGLGSLVGGHGFTLANYDRVLRDADMRASLAFSARLAAITATAATALGLVTARLLTQRGSKVGARVLDMVLLTAVALPGIVFAAGYIFTYNLPWVAHAGIHLYQTTTLLVLAYVATALPPVSRVLVGAVGQVQDSLRSASRVHGSGALGSWLRVVLPLLARPLVTAWLLTFAATLLELPVSQLLYPPNHPPVAVGIEKALANYDFGGGTAMEVIAIGLALAVVAVAWGLYRLLSPAGWRRVGTTR